MSEAIDDVASVVVLPLAARQVGRIRLYVVAALFGLFAIGSAAGAVTFALGDSERALARAALVLMCVLLAFVFGVAGSLLVLSDRQAPAYLYVRPDQLVIEHGGYLREPLSIPRSSIRCVVVDDRPSRRKWREPDKVQKRFPVLPAQRPRAPAAQGSRAPEHLYPWESGATALPSFAPGVPNLAILFREPLVIDQVRWGRWLWSRLASESFPSAPAGRRAVGIFLRLADAQAAPPALLEHLVHPVSPDHVLPLLGGPEERRKARAGQVAWAGFFLGLLGLVEVVDPGALFGQLRDDFIQRGLGALVAAIGAALAAIGIRRRRS